MVAWALLAFITSVLALQHESARFIGLANEAESDQSSCSPYRPLCEVSGSCPHVQVPSNLNDLVNAKFTVYTDNPMVLERFGSLKVLKNKHLRIRTNYKCLRHPECSFFTHSLFVMNQLKLAKRMGLIGNKKPFVYMPEKSGNFDCYESAKELNSKPDFWEKWFEPVSPGVHWRDLDDADVWEFSQETILSSFFDFRMIHAFPYGGKNDKGTKSWISANRFEAWKVMQDFNIKPKAHLRNEAGRIWQKLVSNSSSVLGIFAPKTKKVPGEKIKSEDYQNVAKSFLSENPNGTLLLATDSNENELLHSFEEKLNGKLVMYPSARFSLEQSSVQRMDKDAKSKNALMNALILSKVSVLAKSWSEIGEFAVYFRNDRKTQFEVNTVIDFSIKPTMAVYAIALEKRWDHVYSQLKQLGLHKKAEIRRASSPSDIRYHMVHPNCNLNVYEISCTLSHHHIYSRFLEQTQDDYALIFEDDFELEPQYKGVNIAKLIDDLITIKKTQKAKWDIVNLGRCYDCCESSYGQKEIFRIPKDKVDLPAMKNYFVTKTSANDSESVSLVTSKSASCAHAYLVNRKGAKALLDLSMPILDISDDVLVQSGEKKMAHYVSITPRIFRQRRKHLGSVLNPGDTNDVECNPYKGACDWARV